MIHRFFLVVVVLGALAASGCAASPIDPPPTSATGTIAVPSGGQLLTDYKFEHAPFGFSVPEGLNPTIMIDQENLVTLGLTPEDGLAVHAYLTQHVSAMGFTIDGSSVNSLVFHNEQWDGALTVATETAALTLRLVG